MIDEGIPERTAWPAGILDGLALWQQGDVIRNPPLFYLSDPKRAIWWPELVDHDQGEVVIVPSDVRQLPKYGVVTTQTCDIAEQDSKNPQRPWVQLAPVYRADRWRKKLPKGLGPQYLYWLPDIPEEGVWAADLRIEIPVEKGWLVGQQRMDVFGERTDLRHRFAERLAQLRARPALATALASIHRTLQLRIDKLSNFGEPGVLDGLEEVAVRVSDRLAPQWEQIVILTSSDLTESLREDLENWHDEAMLQVGSVVLLPLEFIEIGKTTVAEYWQMIPVWRK